MKITAVDVLRFTPTPIANPTPPRPGATSAPAVPMPIHIYPEFPRQRGMQPGDVTGEMWVRVTAENGEVGYGHTHWGDLAEPVVRSIYAPLLMGRDCMAIEYLGDVLWRASLRFGPTGISALARSAIDVALWDLKGKLLGVPVYSLLGGPCRAKIPCYVTTHDLDWAMELGFTAFKIPDIVLHDEGTDGINRLEDYVAAARDKVGARADLSLNPVMSFTVDYAIRVMERLQPYCLRWFEEPLMPWNSAGLAELKRAVPTLPIATGEDHRGRHEFADLIDRRCVDVLQPDIRWAGGLSETVKVHTLGEAAGIETIAHAGGGMAAGQHFAAAMTMSPMAEWVMFSPAGVPLSEASRVPGVSIPADGYLTPNTASGLGYEFTEDQFRRW